MIEITFLIPCSLPPPACFSRESSLPFTNAQTPHPKQAQTNRTKIICPLFLGKIFSREDEAQTSEDFGRAGDPVVDVLVDDAKDHLYCPWELLMKRTPFYLQLILESPNRFKRGNEERRTKVHRTRTKEPLGIPTHPSAICKHEFILEIPKNPIFFSLPISLPFALAPSTADPSSLQQLTFKKALLFHHTTVL